jgi:hypothetical protein
VPRAFAAAFVTAVAFVLPSAAGAATSLLSTGGPGLVDVQLDADPELEQVAVRAAGEFEREAVVIDVCAGTRTEHVVALREEFLAVDLLALPGRPKLLISGTSGATGRLGRARVVELQTVGCGLRTLLTSPARRGPTAQPRRYRGTARGAFGVGIRETAAGDVLLQQGSYYRRTDPGCCPSYARTAVLNFDAAADRFVRGRVTYRRVRRP